MAWAATVATTGAASPAAAAPTSTWTVIESANFRLCALADRPTLDALAATCEATREQLCSKWLGKGRHAPWDVKCYVVLHPTAQSYLHEVGQGQMTAGSSLIEFGTDRLVTRRIDLRADHPQGYADALAHELTHVVVAQRFIERQIPRWADEGMAVMADAPAKQSLHLADLTQARSQGQMFRLVELVNLEQYPSPDRQATFYGQSTSLVRFLVERGGPQRFVDFVNQATAEGYETALRRTYGIETLGQLERQWLVELDRHSAVGRADAASPSGTHDRSVALKSN
ncbi:MAG TPA: hypothetical protein VIK18_03810 [Pirellulales bacterium]